MITRDVTTKEQVVRFGFDFFKFAGSAAGTAETGFNDLTFKVSPLEGTNEITGAEDETITAYNEFFPTSETEVHSAHADQSKSTKKNEPSSKIKVR